MPLNFGGKLHDLFHGKPENLAAPSSYDTKPIMNEPSTARPSSPMMEHQTPPSQSSSKPISTLGNSSPTSRASNSTARETFDDNVRSTTPLHSPPRDQSYSQELSAFNAKWEAPIARQRRYNKGLPPLPGQPEYTEEEKREAKGLKQIEEMYMKIKTEDLLESACKTADENYKKWMDEDRRLRERNHEEHGKGRKGEDDDA